MIGIDAIREILATLKQNKLRTVLTGLAVSWGIFILIVLLGAGNGLRNGVVSNFAGRSSNSMRLWSGSSSMPYQGLKADRSLPFTEKELNLMFDELPEVNKGTAVITSGRRNFVYKNEYGSFDLYGVSPAYSEIFNLVVDSEGGRFINDLDMKNRHKTVVLDKKIADELFKNRSALGEYLQIGSIMFQVVGINLKKEEWGGPRAYIPFTTAQTIYNPDKKFYHMAFLIDGLASEIENEEFEDRVTNVMARSLRFDPADSRAIWIQNNQKDYLETMRIFGGLNIFVGIIGIFTLIAGVVGVSNILLVSVKERTREIGIRKAIGAPPATILSAIMLESVLITAVFGYIGMLCGTGLIELIGMLMAQAGDADGPTVFKDPSVEMSYVFVSTSILILAGVIAGYIPARRAVGIKPIEAMREV
ncbi:MAG: ABC transporter permease [Prevotellaceae bacterium]|jgi:putative ABC transport system permease protein|nr:ABC transporter permease [Prevotellaceae bacterium]